jgi:hypothetical protein
MKKLILVFAAFVSFSAFADFSGQLNPEDQKYYKNESGAGMNQLERIDSTVKEINKMHGEISALKSEVEKLKKEVELLKKK